MLFRTRDGYGLRLARLRLDGSKAGALLKLGLPCGIQYSIFGLANLFIQIGVNSFDATVVAGNSAAANADSLVYDVMAAFYTACSSFIGQNYGAGNRARIRKAYRWTCSTASAQARSWAGCWCSSGGSFSRSSRRRPTSSTPA